MTITIEEIARLQVLPEDIREGDPTELVKAINKRIVEAGVEFGESDFSMFFYAAEEMKRLSAYRWITATPVRGGNEGFFIDLTAVPKDHMCDPSIRFASAKTWDWESAIRIAAVANRVLSWY